MKKSKIVKNITAVGPIRRIERLSLEFILGSGIKDLSCPALGPNREAVRGFGRPWCLTLSAPLFSS